VEPVAGAIRQCARLNVQQSRIVSRADRRGRSPRRRRGRLARTSTRTLPSAVGLLTRNCYTILTCGERGHRLDGSGAHWPWRWRSDWP
jgi:hypothetical protein